MPKLRWTLIKNPDVSKYQKKFEQYLTDNGFEITGYRYYKHFNEYQIEKDGCVIEYRVHCGEINFKYFIKAFEDYWQTSGKYHKIGGKTQ